MIRSFKHNAKYSIASYINQQFNSTNKGLFYLDVIYLSQRTYQNSNLKYFANT